MGKITAIVNVGNNKVEVQYWAELQEQWGADGLKDFLFAEALKALGRLDDAIVYLSGKASGNLTQNSSGGYIDTRNWQQNWIDSYRN